MEANFRPAEYLKELAEDLVSSFERAGRATTPSLVGAAREAALRKQLSLLLPPLATVGSGCVVDSSGSTSKQQDVLIYERDLCPVFCLNDSPETTYYPCENVIAVGEVKSSLDRRGLEDAFNKIKSVKALNRYSPNPLSWRTYGGHNSFLGADSEIYDPSSKFMDQIYGFILCKNISMNLDNFLSIYRDLVNDTTSYLRPNLLVSLADGCIVYLNKDTNKIYTNSSETTGVALTNIPGQNFQYLLTRLHDVIVHGRTAEILPYQRYILDGNGSMQVLKYAPYAHT
jgi:hypothetical protein